MTKSYLLLYVRHHCHEITKLTEVQLLCYVSCNSPIVSLKDFLLSSAPETHLHFPVHSILYHKDLP